MADNTTPPWTPPAFNYQYPDYSTVNAATGFGYNNLIDQMRDAFSIPSRGAGVFMGNTAPRYGKPAPNLTFPTAFLGLLQSFIHPQGGQGTGAPGATPVGAGGMQPFQPQGLLRGR